MNATKMFLQRDFGSGQEKWNSQSTLKPATAVDKKAEVRSRLYSTALHLFLERGYENTTVQEITDLADVAKATFFNYFPTKEHVLAAYHNEMRKIR